MLGGCTPHEIYREFHPATHSRDIWEHPRTKRLRENDGIDIFI